jgi:hypothetical protein
MSRPGQKPMPSKNKSLILAKCLRGAMVSAPVLYTVGWKFESSRRHNHNNLCWRKEKPELIAGLFLFTAQLILLLFFLIIVFSVKALLEVRKLNSRLLAEPCKQLCLVLGRIGGHAEEQHKTILCNHVRWEQLEYLSVRLRYQSFHCAGVITLEVVELVRWRAVVRDDA